MPNKLPLNPAKARKGFKTTTARAQKRVKAGIARTNEKIRVHRLGLSRPYVLTYRPHFFEKRVDGKGWCQQHAFNNALGRVVLSQINIEARRQIYNSGLKDPTRPRVNPSGYWPTKFILDLIRQVGVRLVSAKLGFDGSNPALFLKNFLDKFPLYGSQTFVLYLNYNEMGRGVRKEIPTQVCHAVALRDGRVIDSDLPENYYPLASYPLLYAVTAVYNVSFPNRSGV